MIATPPRSPSQISAYPHNLAHRLEKPAQGNGRIQKAALRALWAHEGSATTAQVAEWAYCRKLEIEKRRLTKSDYRHIRRALDAVADRIGRAGGMGRPILTPWIALSLDPAELRAFEALRQAGELKFWSQTIQRLAIAVADMSDSAIIFAPELAAKLGVSQDVIYELARCARLPFAVSSASPRQLCIDASHLHLWKAAVSTACCET